MALLLQQKYNLKYEKEIDAVVNFFNRVEAAAAYLATKIRESEIDYTTLTNYSMFLPSFSQIVEWCNRCQDSAGMARRMMDAIESDSTITLAVINTNDAANDTLITNAVRRCICAYAARI